MAIRTSNNVLGVYLWSVTVVVCEYIWSVTYNSKSISALKGSTVEMNCSYTYPSSHFVKSTFWATKLECDAEPKDLGQDPAYSGRVTYHNDKNNVNILRIKDLRNSDSAVYKFRFITDQPKGKWTGEPGVTLYVTDPEDGWGVTYPTQRICTLERSTVELSCSYSYPHGYTVTDTFWFINKNRNYVKLTEDPAYKDRVTYSTNKNNGHTVMITDLRKSDSVEFLFRFITYGDEYKYTGTPGVTLSVIEGWRVTYTPQTICALKGSTVNLSCSYSYPQRFSVISTFWLNKYDTDGNCVNLKDDPLYGDRVTYNKDKNYGHTLRIDNLMESDSAKYQFRFITSEPKGSYIGPNGVILSVAVVVLEMVPKSVTEGDRVTLTCRTTCTLKPIPEYIWYKNGQIIENSKSYSTTRNISVTSEDVGRYSCAVKGHEDIRSTEENLSVRYGPKSTSVSVSPSGEIVEGSSVTLTCSSDANPPVNKYSWYKKSVTSSKASGQSYNITNIRSEDSGEYYCEAENTFGNLNSSSVSVDIYYGPKSTSVSVSPSGEIVEGSSVTLTCSSDANPPVDKYTWYKKNVTLPQASGQSYSITNITSEDSGEYYCEAENKYGRLNSSTLFVDVHYGPKNTSVSASPSGEIVEGSSLTLTCSSDANQLVDKYTWYKKNVTSPKASGQSYNINKIRSEDSGEYYCVVQNGRVSNNSTALIIIVAGKQTLLTAAVITVVVLVLIICLSGIVWYRKKLTKLTANNGQEASIYGNVPFKAVAPTGTQRTADNGQEGVYANANFV